MTKDYLAVLDACVLVGGGLRDTLLRLAETPRLYVPKWSSDIMDEMSRTLQDQKFQKTEKQTQHLHQELLKAFPEAWVTGYKDIEPDLKNDPKDRHVLAAPSAAPPKPSLLSTEAFPSEALQPFDVEAIHPDEFLVNQFYWTTRSYP